MAQTRIVIAASGQEFTLPGTHWTVAEIVSTFSSSVNGIGSMTADESGVEGGDKTITFRQRTGTKG